MDQKPINIQQLKLLKLQTEFIIYQLYNAIHRYHMNPHPKSLEEDYHLKMAGLPHPFHRYAEVRELQLDMMLREGKK